MDTTHRRSSQHVYDYVIIGSGLSGLLIASGLSKLTSNVLLLESAETFGGQNRRGQNLSADSHSSLQAANNGLRFFPGSELAQKSVQFLQEMLGSSVGATCHDHSILTYQGGSLRPFIGFGENPPPYYDELAYFLSPHQLTFTLPIFEWTNGLFSQFTGDFLPRNYVTKFHEEDGLITSLTVNGQKTIRGTNFIYCSAVKDLLVLLPENGFSAKTRQKLSKAKSWTGICLDLSHGQKISESSALHLFTGTPQDESHPCIGQFQHALVSENGETLQLSQWLTFINEEEAEDAEQIGLALKRIKRQIKHAYPNAFADLRFEKILVAPAISGISDCKVNSDQSLPAYKNFWLGSGAVNAQKNLLGTLLQSALVTSALGCLPNQQISDISL